MVTLIVVPFFVYSCEAADTKALIIETPRYTEVVYIRSNPAAIKSTISTVLKHRCDKDSTIHEDNCWLHGFLR
jgi:hypothetical protein